MEVDFAAFLGRMRRRLYPETLPVLAWYWVRTLYANGYQRRWWNDLNHLLARAREEQPLDEASCRIITGVQAWIERRVFSAHQSSWPVLPRLEPARPSLGPEQLVPYASRLLNEWLPVEISRLLIDESASELTEQDGIPVLSAARALERLLVRERLSEATLENLLRPELLTPQYAYPADSEILRDVILYLLRRTVSPAPCVLPAMLLGVACDSHLPADYSEAVRRSSLAQGPSDEAIYVPISQAHAKLILSGAPVRLGSLIVTTDGRLWESQNLESGQRHSVAYRPVGRLRIDYSSNHAELRVPWPANRLEWSGDVSFREKFRLFGREWRVARWEQHERGACVHLTVSRVLSISDIAPDAAPGLRRSRPASIDIAWTALENALSLSIAQKDLGPIEGLRHTDLIALGRAIFAFGESLRLRNRETIDDRARAVRFHYSQVSSAYGRVPWRVLSPHVRTALLKKPGDKGLWELIDQVFDQVPEQAGKRQTRAA